MKYLFRFAVPLTLIFALATTLLAGCNQSTNASDDNPPPEPQPTIPLIPQDLDAATGSMGNLVLAIDTAVYQEATGDDVELEDHMPAFVKTITTAFGLDYDIGHISNSCTIVYSSADADDDGTSLTTYDFDCPIVYSQVNAAAGFRGTISIGDPDDSNANQDGSFGFDFDQMTIYFLLSTPGNVTNMSYNLDGHVYYLPDSHTVRNDYDFDIHAMLSKGETDNQYVYFFPAHLVAFAASAGGDLTLHPSLGDYSTPHWKPYLDPYADITTIATPNGAPVYSKNCQPWGFKSGSIRYTDENGKFVEVDYGNCDTPSFDSDLLR